jgi:hypothetical protein
MSTYENDLCQRVSRDIMAGIFHPDPPWTTESLALEAKRVHKTTVGVLLR